MCSQKLNHKYIILDEGQRRILAASYRSRSQSSSKCRTETEILLNQLNVSFHDKMMQTMLHVLEDNQTFLRSKRYLPWLEFQKATLQHTRQL